MNDFHLNGQGDSLSIQHAGGVFIRVEKSDELRAAHKKVESIAHKLQAEAYLNIQSVHGTGETGIHISSSDRLIAITPEFDTTGIASELNINGLKRSKELELEIILAMSRSPVLFTFPSTQEFETAIRVRRYAALAAYQAELNFDTEGLERPRDYWTYHPDTSFTLLPGVSIIDALIHTTQPALSGQVYSFSCFRASEYILTLALALELRDCHPALHRQIEQRWSKRAIMGEEFQAVFLREYGSISAPIPPRFYVPGERVWFRNPDEPSSNVRGYEGSWLYYLGSGLFNNFWDRQNPYTMTTKCLEIYHWRDGVKSNVLGELTMDESVVARHVTASASDPDQQERILALMMKYRDPSGVYAEGGCIDATRESIRLMHPPSSDIRIPEADQIK
ncbi:MAG: hypothetical protein Q7J51_11200 [Sheuella sp.]|nr:hypothetical protein [Sheuella sp.]